MSERVKNGGSAFPNEGGEYSGLYADPGMSLRDWFAGQIASHTISGAAAAGSSVPASLMPEIAQAAYKMADAMLAERERGQ